MLLSPAISEVEAAAQEMFPGDRAAEGCALFGRCSLDRSSHPIDFVVHDASEIDRLGFDAGYDDGLYELGIGWNIHGFEEGAPRLGSALSSFGWKHALRKSDGFLFHRSCGIAVLVHLGEVVVQEAGNTAVAFVLSDVLEFVGDQF